MASDEIVVEAVASGASTRIDATDATPLKVEEVTTKSIVEAAKTETLIVVEKDNEASVAGNDDKGNNTKASVTSDTAVGAEGTETKGKVNLEKVQKGSAKRKRGKKRAPPAAVAAAAELASGDDKKAATEPPRDDKKAAPELIPGDDKQSAPELTPGEDKMAAVGAVASSNDKKVGETGGTKEEQPLSKKAKRKRARKLALEAAARENAGNGAAGKKVAESTASKKAEKPAGLIFMCNAKTKADCYKYRVFGLPESKKDTVEKIHKGTTLFLYDFDLKLLYGIYKAASRGGYNLQPKAFNSAFPAQVRISVDEDCLPLPSEKFKEAIKANYYGKNKFNVQLSDDQVKSLRKLFRDTTKESKLSSKAELSNAGTPGSKKQGKKRGLENDRESSRNSGTKTRKIVKPVHLATARRGHEIHKRGATYLAPHYSGIVPESAYVREPVYVPREPVYAPREPAYAPREPAYAPRDPIYAPREPVYAPRELVYATEPGYVPPQHQLPPSHAYDRPARVDYYRREEPLEIPNYMLPDSHHSLQREAAAYTRYPGTSSLSGSYTLPPGRRY